jgi:alpha-1,2-mannosyltransferase
MKIVLTHTSLNSAGGGEVVCLALIRALRKQGYEVALVTVDKTDWGLLKKIFGEITFPNHEDYLVTNLPATSFHSIQSILLLSGHFLEVVWKKLSMKDGLLISTCGEKINSIADIVYINGTPLRCAHLLPNVNVARKAVSKVYDLFLKSFDKINTTILIANSNFNKNIVSTCTRKKTTGVVYPPVKLERYESLRTIEDRRNIVVTVARFLPEQNIEMVPRLAQIIQKAEFYVVGPSGETSEHTIEKLQKSISKLGVSDRVKILTNLPRGKFSELLFTAKVFLRTLPHEPFGMSVVEAMAAGCIPVVPEDGGPWFDILGSEDGKYGFSFSNLNEAASKIERVIENDNLRKEVSLRAIRRAKFFEGPRFERAMLQIVKLALESRSFRTRQTRNKSKRRRGASI